MKDIIYTNLCELKTPVGSFRIMSDSGELLRFSVIKNPYDIPYEVFNENKECIGTITTDTNYRILIDVSCLKMDTEYDILFSKGVWNFCDSDEHTECYSTLIDNWAVGIGAFDPNDEKKCSPNFHYDESEFEKYTVDALPAKNGFRFRLLEYSVQTIRFEVAWIRIGEFPTIEYDGAIGFWLT